MDHDTLDRAVPDVAVGSYVASGLTAIGAAGVMLHLVPLGPAVLAFFHYAPPVFAAGAGVATAVAPSHRVPHRLFWATAAVYLAWPIFGIAGIDMPLAAEIAIRLGYGAGMLMGGGFWLRERRSLPAPEPRERLAGGAQRSASSRSLP